MKTGKLDKGGLNVSGFVESFNQSGRYGSVLIFPWYKNAADYNTTHYITNNGVSTVNVHMWFVGYYGGFADLYERIAAGETKSYSIADLDPNYYGFIFVHVADALGDPYAANCLHGTVVVERTGLVDVTYNAIAIKAITPGSGGGADYTFKFDGIEWEMLPTNLALGQISEDSIIVVAPIGGDWTTASSPFFENTPVRIQGLANSVNYKEDLTAVYFLSDTLDVILPTWPMVDSATGLVSSTKDTQLLIKQTALCPVGLVINDDKIVCGMDDGSALSAALTLKLSVYPPP